MAGASEAAVGGWPPEPLVLNVGGPAVRLAVGVNVAIAVIALAIAAVGLVPVNGQSHPDITIAVGVPLFVFLVLLYSATGRRGIVTGDSLVLKNSRWARPHAIPLGEIEAVGMVYTV